MITKSRIINDLKKGGVSKGDILLVHSSLSSIGHVEGGPDTVIDALLEALGQDGTLLMPSFQRGAEFFHCQDRCVFDIRSSPAEHGIITETFRKRSGVMRSLSPTHCTAGIGQQAEELLANHNRCTVSVGNGSPYHKLIEASGKILLLGVTHAANTTLHFIENTNGAPTICKVLFKPMIIDTKGRTYLVPTWPHMPGLPRNYVRIESKLVEKSIQQNIPIGKSQSKLIDAATMAEYVGKKIRHNPNYLINIFNTF